MTEKQEKQMIKAAHKYWADESGGYDKQEIMVDSFVEGYKQASAIHNVGKSLPQDNYCQVCKLPTDGEKCYSKRCPV